MFKFFRKFEGGKRPEAQGGITIFSGEKSDADAISTVPSDAETDSSSYIIHTEIIDQSAETEPESMSEYISQRALADGYAQVDHMATKKYHEHQQALKELTIAKENGADNRTLRSLEHKVNMLQLFLNELRRDGFLPFDPSLMSEKEIDREIQKIRSRLVDDFHSYDRPRDRQTLAMLEEAQRARSQPSGPVETPTASETKEERLEAVE